MDIFHFWKDPHGYFINITPKMHEHATTGHLCVPFSSCNFQGGPIGCNGQRQAGNCRVAEVLRSLRREVFSTFVASPQKELPKEGGRSSGMQINAMISLISSTCLVAEL